MLSDVPGFFKAWGDSEESIISGIEALASSGETWIYREAFRYLIGHDVQDLSAERYWREALASWRNPSLRKSGRQQLRAALLDYLYHVTGERFGSSRDGLTGLHSQSFLRNYIDRFLPYLLNQKNPAASLLSIGVDGLSGYAQRHGSRESDRALRKIAELLRSMSGEQDILCRHQGGFTVFLPGLDEERGRTRAEVMRRGMELSALRGPREIQNGELTLSIGVASLPTHGIGSSDLLRAAREGLEKARVLKNCVQIIPPRLNRRMAKRHRVSSVLDYSPRSGRDYSPAVTYDISDTGAAFGCDGEFAPGQNLLLRFRKPFWPQDRLTPATVVRCTRHKSSGVLSLSVQFEKPLGNFCSFLENHAA